MPGYKNTVFPLIAATLVSAGYSAQAYAEGGWEVEPRIGISLRADDNFSVTSSNKREVVTGAASFSLGARHKSTANDFRGVVSVDAIGYSGDDEGLSSKSNQVLFFSSTHRTSPRNTFRVDFNYKNDTLLREIDVVVDPNDVTIEPDDDVDDGLVRDAVRRNRIIIKPSWRYQLDNLSWVAASLRFNAVDYSNQNLTDEQIAAGSRLKEYEQKAAFFSYGRDITTLDSLAITVGTDKYETKKLLAGEKLNEYETTSLTVGLDHKFSETLTAGVELGVRQTDYVSGDEEGDDTGGTIAFTGRKDTGTMKFSARVARLLFPSGSGDVVQSDEAIFNMSRQMTELSTFSLRSRVYQNRSIRDNPDADRRYFSIEPRMEWKLSQWWSLNASYRFRTEKRDSDASSADSNSVYAELVYSKPTLLSK